jgi:hypothetical protein
VFWTGTTKSGCAGQYSDCFFDEKSQDGIFEGKILPSDNGGACVGFALSGDEFIVKTMPCDRKFFLACQSHPGTKIVKTDVMHYSCKVSLLTLHYTSCIFSVSVNSS